MESVRRFTNIQFEVMLVTEIKTMNPWVIHAVAFRVFSLMLAKIFVLVHKIHETVTVILRDKAEFIVLNLLVGRNINCVIVPTIAIHIIHHHVRIFITSSPSLVNETVMVAGLVAMGKGGYYTIRSGVH